MILCKRSHKAEGDGSSCDKLIFRHMEVVKIPTYDSANFVRWVNESVFYRASRSFFSGVPPEAVVL